MENEQEKHEYIYVKMADKKTNWGEAIIAGLGILGGALLSIELLKMFAKWKRFLIVQFADII